jgi:hypothetical protein
MAAVKVYGHTRFTISDLVRQVWYAEESITLQMFRLPFYPLLSLNFHGNFLTFESVPNGCRLSIGRCFKV